MKSGICPEVGDYTRICVVYTISLCITHRGTLVATICRTSLASYIAVIFFFFFFYKCGSANPYTPRFSNKKALLKCERMKYVLGLRKDKKIDTFRLWVDFGEAKRMIFKKVLLSFGYFNLYCLVEVYNALMGFKRLESSRDYSEDEKDESENKRREEPGKQMMKMMNDRS